MGFVQKAFGWFLVGFWLGVRLFLENSTACFLIVNASFYCLGMAGSAVSCVGVVVLVVLIPLVDFWAVFLLVFCRVSDCHMHLWRV